jgi:hypothetical protein
LHKNERNLALLFSPLTFAILLFIIPTSANAMTLSGPVALSTVTLSGNITIDTVTLSSATFDTLQVSSGIIPSFMIVGTTTTNNSPKGRLGEYVESIVSATNFTASGVWGDLTSISLTSGDWDVSVCGGEEAGPNGPESFELAISTTSGNNANGISVSNSARTFYGADPDAGGSAVISIAPYRITLQTSTVVYLKYWATYSGGAPIASGRISARRSR